MDFKTVLGYILKQGSLLKAHFLYVYWTKVALPQVSFEWNFDDNIIKHRYKNKFSGPKSSHKLVS